jgi:hypothetical protein
MANGERAMRAFDGEPRRLLGTFVGSILAVGGAAAAEAGDASWIVELEPVYVVIDGHDQHVLTVRRAGGDEKQELDTDSALGYRAAVLWDRDLWAYGLDFFIHRTDQGLGPLAEAAGGAGQPVAYEVPHRSFVSTGPDEVLYYQSLADTTVELWVLDLYARRQLGAGEEGPWSVLFGVRNADFDNDMRGIAGLGDVGGTRIDASSNYSRLIGPMAGVAMTFESGRNTLDAGLRLSVVFGDIELQRTLRDFEGPPGPFAGPPEEVPPLPVRESLHTTDSIEVPMADLVLAWRYRLGERWSLGARFDATAWSDLAVPPGVVPDHPDRLEETTLVTWGLGATLGFRF